MRLRLKPLAVGMNPFRGSGVLTAWWAHANSALGEACKSPQGCGCVLGRAGL